MTHKLSQYAFYGSVIALVLAVMYMLGASAIRAGASVSVTDEYTATSTAPTTIYGATISASKRIKTGQGTLGSVVITGAGTGVINLYNATTSNVSLRTGQVATSTILLASFPASTAAGTYTLDVLFTAGLYVDLVSGEMATSTITYR